MFNRKRPIYTDFYQSNFFALSSEVVDDFFDRVAKRPHAHNYACRISGAVVIEKTVIGVQFCIDARHATLDRGREVVVYGIYGFSVLEINVRILVGSPHVRMLRIERGGAKTLKRLEIVHVFEICVVPDCDFLHFVRGPKSIKEIDERYLPLKRGHVRNRSEIHDFLRIGLGEHSKTRLPTGHDIGMIAKNTKSVRSDGTRSYVKDARELLGRNLIHVGNHEQQALRSGIRCSQGARAKSTVNGAGSACFRLHLDDTYTRAKHIFLALR